MVASSVSIFSSIQAARAGSGIRTTHLSGGDVLNSTKMQTLKEPCFGDPNVLQGSPAWNDDARRQMASVSIESMKRWRSLSALSLMMAFLIVVD